MTVAGFTPAAWACAGFAALACLLLVRSPAGRLRRISDPAAGRSRTWPFLAWLAGRPDAPSLARRGWISTLAALAVCLAVSRFDGGPGRLSWAGVPVLALVLTAGLGRLEPLATRRRDQELTQQAPQALELLAACLAAGMPVRLACAAVTDAFDDPVASDLGRVQSVTALGVSDADAWRALQDHPQFGGAAADLARSVESGTMMVEGLRHHAEVARARRRAALQVRARAVGVRSVLPLMVCFIPSFMLLGVVPTVVSAVTHALQR